MQIADVIGELLSRHHVTSAPQQTPSPLWLTLESIPEPDRRPINPVPLYFARNLVISLLLATISSFSLNNLAMVWLL